jgi:hypothetical protein
MELLEAVNEVIKRFAILAGSVVVLCSASHLAELGTETYVAEIEEATFKLAKIMGNGMCSVVISVLVLTNPYQCT